MMRSGEGGGLPAPEPSPKGKILCGYQGPGGGVTGRAEGDESTKVLPEDPSGWRCVQLPVP